MALQMQPRSCLHSSFLLHQAQTLVTYQEFFSQEKQFDNYLNERFIFMKWKEKFLVPDALLMEGVDGASYDGFYYIVHDQVTGNIQGFYYHQDAEKFQQLELVPSLKK
ncbi:Vid24p [Saccharomyces cerevisiae Lalvin QA23]|nr:Vid24p [Saccharomyces cerevisiae Lalvin QA23]